MRMSEQINELASALALAQAEMKNARLNKQNPHFKSRYADLSEIRDTVTPSLSKNGLAITQGLDTTDDGKLLVVTRMLHKSGQWIESRFPISHDKPQAMGSAITYGRRYTLSAICNIAADEDDDAEVAQSRPSYQGTQKPVAAPPPKQQEPQQAESTALVDIILRKFNEAESAAEFEDLVQRAQAKWGKLSVSEKARISSSIEARRAYWIKNAFADAMPEAAE